MERDARQLNTTKNIYISVRCCYQLPKMTLIPSYVTNFTASILMKVTRDIISVENQKAWSPTYHKILMWNQMLIWCGEGGKNCIRNVQNFPSKPHWLESKPLKKPPFRTKLEFGLQLDWKLIEHINSLYFILYENSKPDLKYTYIYRQHVYVLTLCVYRRRIDDYETWLITWCMNYLIFTV